MFHSTVVSWSAQEYIGKAAGSVVFQQPHLEDKGWCALLNYKIIYIWNESAALLLGRKNPRYVSTATVYAIELSEIS
jgi:hypothetical protein